MKRKEWKEFCYRILPLFALFFIILLVIYFPILSRPFAVDEKWIIENNQTIQSSKNLSKIFFQPWPQQKMIKLYRPMVYLWLMVNYGLWGPSPLGYRIMGCALYAVLSVLIYLIFRQKNFCTSMAFSFSFLFLVHPVHIMEIHQSVCHGDTLCAVFCLASWLCYQSGKKYRSLLFFILACLSKETALALLPVIGWHILLFDKEEIITKIKKISPYICIVFCYLLMRTYALSGLSETHNAFDGFSLITRIRTMSFAFWVYIKLSLLPFPLGYDYQLNDFPILDSFAHPLFILSFLGILVYFSVIYFAAKQKKTDIAFWLGWFFLFLLPVSNIIPTAIVIGERFLSLPLLGFMMLVAIFCQKYFTKKLFHSLVAAAVIFYLSIIAYHLPFFSAEQKIWQRTLSLSPNSYIAHMKLGSYYHRQKQSAMALDHFKRAVDLRCYRHNGPMAPINCALIYLQRNNLEASLHYYAIAIARMETLPKLTRQDALSCITTGRIYLHKNQKQNAQKCFLLVINKCRDQKDLYQKSLEYLSLCKVIDREK